VEGGGGEQEEDDEGRLYDEMQYVGEGDVMSYCIIAIVLSF
jgi:hypothetical protein